METWKLKSCPRCGGDIFVDCDEEKNWSAQCLQCGYVHQMENPHPVEKEPVYVEVRRRHHRRHHDETDLNNTN